MFEVVIIYNFLFSFHPPKKKKKSEQNNSANPESWAVQQPETVIPSVYWGVSPGGNIYLPMRVYLAQMGI